MKNTSDAIPPLAAPPCSPVRVVLSRKAGWRMPANTVKVCRPTKYGNPHRVGFCHVCGVEHTQAEAVEEFRAMLELAEIPSDLSELRGKNLACWCKEGKPCHADVLLDLANAPAMPTASDGRPQV